MPGGTLFFRPDMLHAGNFSKTSKQILFFTIVPKKFKDAKYTTDYPKTVLDFAIDTFREGSESIYFKYCI